MLRRVARYDRLNPARFVSFLSSTICIIATFHKLRDYSGPTGQRVAIEMSITTAKFNAYVLPGHVSDARAGLDQARTGEALGLGGIFLSERWDTKELGAVMGALTQVTDRVKLVAGLTHFGTRHPLVLAGMGATLQTLSGGRFVLGFGRSVPPLLGKLGIKAFDNAGMADFVALLRRLWAGETINYSGPAGNFPEMQLTQRCLEPPPVILGAVGPNTLALAGAHFDGVVLHPFLTTEGVERSVAIVRGAARESGRDPNSITVYATVVTVPDTLPSGQREDILEARAVSYFMHRELGLMLADINNWDRDPVDRVVEKGLNRLEFGRSDIATARRQMGEAAALLPPHWLMDGAAVGSVGHCLRRLDDYFSAGADEILLHGTTCDQQAPLLEALHGTQL
ncbi:MAG: 5,10-methylenetetrahydromethanopterin reductase [Gammaproteobacteria bacterium]|jgi:5,10-methylenetetrahydromethanopterin reductase